MTKNKGNAKHFMIYYQKGSGTYVVTTPRRWANENRAHFEGHDFIITHPTTDEIENWLVNNKGFVFGNTQKADVAIIYNFNANLVF